MERQVPEFQEIADFIRDLNFKKAAWGVDEEDVFACIQDLDAMYKDKLIQVAQTYEGTLQSHQKQAADQARALEQLQHRVQQLQQAAAQPAQGQQQSPAAQTEYQKKLEEMTGLISTLKQNNEVVEQHARQKAEQLLADAQQKADRLLSESEQKAGELRAQAKREAQKQLDDAQANADQMLSEARIKAAQITTEARVGAERAGREIRQQLQQEEDQRRATLRQLEQERAAALTKLQAIRSDLSSMTEALGMLRDKFSILERGAVSDRDPVERLFSQDYQPPHDSRYSV